MNYLATPRRRKEKTFSALRLCDLARFIPLNSEPKAQVCDATGAAQSTGAGSTIILQAP
jgi:hypothetical protein